ncbi:MAG: leucyl aminopeptidase [Rhodospirillaceae bacterium]|nr:leucyl aminopeptidase [Rhodospirillaceae bacterium]
MKVVFSRPEAQAAGALVVGVFENRRLGPAAEALDRRTGGLIARALAASRFKGNAEEVLQILAPAGLEASRILLVGLGKPEAVEALGWQKFGGRLTAALNAEGETAAVVPAQPFEGSKLDPAEIAANIAFGVRLRSYRFDKYRTKEKPEQKPSLERVTVAVDDVAAAKRAYDPLDKLADAVVWTRDLVSEPGNVIYPETLAREARKLEALGVSVEVLGEKEMRKLGMGALLAVAQGSDHEPRLVVMEWDGVGARPKGERRKGEGRPSGPVALVGKGVTFDSGGISLKQAQGMEEMKWDMAGAAAVIGTMHVLAARKARAHVVGVVGLVENMPSGKAQRPGDIVRSMSGQTIEVINTDAEGRLVLADAIWYARDRFKPQLVIDLATLTGAIIIALGHFHAGLYSNKDELAQQLLSVGKAVGEPLWRMPLGEEYDKLMNSDAADMKNAGVRHGGSITAAQFIQRFVESTPWAHLDIAGTAWSDKETALRPKGATGFGVQLLDRFIAQHHEQR